MNKIYKFIWPITILAGCAILGWFYYASKISEEKSVEKQQQVDIQENQTEQEATIERTQSSQSAFPIAPYHP